MGEGGRGGNVGERQCTLQFLAGVDGPLIPLHDEADVAVAGGGRHCADRTRARGGAAEVDAAGSVM